ncbi:MAG TPA: cytochrome c family protein [Candidatus Eisenbacteria bacterium]|nr:cytochrome c family protein [Candidatus Eisenbacteria bacterium]
MNRSKIWMRLLLVVLGIAVATQATKLWAYPETARQQKAAACASCHTNVAGGAALNEAGAAFKADNAKAVAAAAKAAQYVGVNKCKMCHVKQHKAWATTAHAKAWAGLKKTTPEKAAEMATALKVEIKGSPATTEGCVSCHVTGFQLAGGYPQADTAKAANVVNVTCEGCHGPGSLHVTAPAAEKKKTINRAVTANMCKQCHTPATSPKFDFAEYSKRGVHTVAAAK